MEIMKLETFFIDSGINPGAGTCVSLRGRPNTTSRRWLTSFEAAIDRLSSVNTVFLFLFILPFFLPRLSPSSLSINSNFRNKIMVMRRKRLAARGNFYARRRPF